jgi:DNA-binding response OmpR family regulator
MPGRSGLDVLKDIREAAPHVPVVILTGGSTTEERDEARRLGACEVLTKPVNWNHLRNIAYLYSFLKEPTGRDEGGERP